MHLSSWLHEPEGARALGPRLLPVGPPPSPTGHTRGAALGPAHRGAGEISGARKVRGLGCTWCNCLLNCLLRRMVHPVLVKRCIKSYSFAISCVPSREVGGGGRFAFDCILGRHLTRPHSLYASWGDSRHHAQQIARLPSSSPLMVRRGGNVQSRFSRFCNLTN